MEKRCSRLYPARSCTAPGGAVWQEPSLPSFPSSVSPVLGPAGSQSSPGHRPARAAPTGTPQHHKTWHGPNLAPVPQEPSKKPNRACLSAACCALRTGLKIKIAETREYKKIKKTSSENTGNSKKTNREKIFILFLVVSSFCSLCTEHTELSCIRIILQQFSPVISMNTGRQLPFKKFWIFNAATKSKAGTQKDHLQSELVRATEKRKARYFSCSNTYCHSEVSKQEALNCSTRHHRWALCTITLY